MRESALRFLVGESAPLSPSSISRLNKKFKDEYENWAKRNLSDLKIVYLWADGIYLKAGIADEKRCLLVIIGVDISGKKHLLAMREGFRESPESWYHCLVDLQRRGLNELALALAEPIRIRILGGTAESVAPDQRAVVLVAQNAEYPRQIAEGRTFGSGAEIARNLFGK